MYATLWRILPGPAWARVLVVLIFLAVVLFTLATWVFPWVDSIVNNQEATVGGP
jgi:polyferredoxin